MIDLNEINDEIARLEHGNTTYAACEKLSVLYTVRSQLAAGEAPEKVERSISSYSYASAPKSEFMQAVENAPLDGVMNVIDEHLEAVKALFPKEYNAVIKMIKEL